MPTAPTHALAAVAIGSAFPQRLLPKRFWLIGAVAAMAPDADVLGFRIGIRYGDFLGHRGFTHSLVFAAGLAMIAVWVLGSGGMAAVRAQRLYLFIAVASHGLLDALTDGGLGVGLLAPFDNTRYFLPVRPITVWPIGVTGFFSVRSWAVVRSELLWVWLPSAVAIAVLWLRERRAAASNPRSAF